MRPISQADALLAAKLMRLGKALTFFSCAVSAAGTDKPAAFATGTMRYWSEPGSAGRGRVSVGGRGTGPSAGSGLTRAPITPAVAGPRGGGLQPYGVAQAFGAGQMRGPAPAVRIDNRALGRRCEPKPGKVDGRRARRCDSLRRPEETG